MHQPDHVLPGTRNGACSDLSHRTVLAPIYHTERCLLRSTSQANALTIQNFPTSIQELSSEVTVLTFKLSNQITIQQATSRYYCHITNSPKVGSREGRVQEVMITRSFLQRLVVRFTNVQTITLLCMTMMKYGLVGPARELGQQPAERFYTPSCDEAFCSDRSGRGAYRRTESIGE